MQGQAQHPRRILHLHRHADIGIRGRGIARRVVVELSTNLMQHIDK